ncbi:MAG: MFS transporter [Pegethrix bostrychoides GSE-TBD4-15B]|jgi:MFS family permease|uniref:MFS transporter n=1 Tax=Pegethrix bostrychoides GSE-TBD4-15B TaxID=2839662 RepID=A0A951P858_9CYAN|nr:MFS transporter [Pegethrix bostrychoides GSE-TBD4-15B]
MNRTYGEAKRTVALLVLCQAISMTSITMLFTVAALIGAALSSDKSLATLPVALLQVAVMLTTIPASLIMQRWGRRAGFGLGTVVGMVGAGLAVVAVLMQSFSLFCLATVLFGIFNGFAGFYRFAAADAATDSFRPQAISLVVAGGVVAAVLGPSTASWAKDWLSVPFAGSLLPIVGLQALTLVVLQSLDLLPMTIASGKSGAGESSRPLGIILRQPLFGVAAISSMVGYSVMVLLMTATPLAMTAVPHPFSQAAFVIQWHVLGMFAPSFVTGSLIQRFGVLNIILGGIGLNLLAIGINLNGTSVQNFLVALTLLGIGWNWMFVGATTLLTQAYLPSEKAKTQAAHDFLMFSSVALSAFLSGRLLNSLGWATVNQLATLPLLIALGAVLWLRFSPQAISPSEG